MMAVTKEHKGLPVRKHSLALRGASGDALNGPMKVSPVELQPGVPVFMVIEIDPSGETFKPMDDSEAYEEMQIGRVKRGAFLDAKIALPYLDDVTVQLADLKEKERGQDKISDTLTLEADHAAGLHRRKRNECPLCVARSDADVARADELAAKRAEHGDGEGDAENPLPGARRRRSRPAGVKGAAKKAATPKRTRKATAKK